MPAHSHSPTDKQIAEVEAYAAVGVPHHDIARLIGISTHTLLKHYEHQLGVGKAKANAQVAKSLFRQAIDGNISAAIFWLKAQAGWREVQVVEHTGGTTLNVINADTVKAKLDSILAERAGGKAKSDTLQ